MFGLLRRSSPLLGTVLATVYADRNAYNEVGGASFPVELAGSGQELVLKNVPAA